jgi:hypothetical protein
MEIGRSGDEAVRPGNAAGWLSRLSLRPSSQVEDWAGEAPARGLRRHGSTVALLCALALTAVALRALAERSDAVTRLARATSTPASSLARPAGHGRPGGP